MENITEETAPTPQQNELFKLTVRNFVNTATSHRRVLADSHLALDLTDISKWIHGRELPDELQNRSHIMDFIWTHYCNCKCS